MELLSRPQRKVGQTKPFFWAVFVGWRRGRRIFSRSKHGKFPADVGRKSARKSILGVDMILFWRRGGPARGFRIFLRPIVWGCALARNLIGGEVGDYWVGGLSIVSSTALRAVGLDTRARLLDKWNANVNCSIIVVNFVDNNSKALQISQSYEQLHVENKKFITMDDCTKFFNFYEIFRILGIFWDFLKIAIFCIFLLIAGEPMSCDI